MRKMRARVVACYLDKDGEVMAQTRAEARYLALLGIPEPPKPPASLLDRHRDIIDHWFESGCLSKRASLMACGYSDTSMSIWHRPEVVEEIQRRRDRLEYKQEVTEEWVTEKFRKIANADLADLMDIQANGEAFIDLSAMTPEHRAAISEYEMISSESADGERRVVKAKIKMPDKLAALHALARIKGMLKDKLEVSVGLSLGDKVQQARMRLVEQKTIEGDPVDANSSS